MDLGEYFPSYECVEAADNPHKPELDKGYAELL
jgi:hypothetical protein